MHIKPFQFTTDRGKTITFELDKLDLKSMREAGFKMSTPPFGELIEEAAQAPEAIPKEIIVGIQLTYYSEILHRYIAECAANNEPTNPAELKRLYNEFIALTTSEIERLAKINGEKEPPTAEISRKIRGAGFMLSDPIMLNTKLHNRLTELSQYQGEKIPVIVGAKKSEDVEIIASVDIIDSRGVRLVGEELDTIDRAIYNEICTAFIETENTNSGYICLSPEQLHRALTGKNSAERVSDEQKADIIRRISKLCNTYVYADLTEQARAYNLNLKSRKEEGRLLTIRKKVTETHNSGNQLEFFEFSAPLLLDYARGTKQLYKIPRAAYRITDSTGQLVKTSGGRISLNHYIIKRVFDHKHNPKMRNIIDISNIYSEYGTNEANKNEKKRAREYAEIVFDNLKRGGYIQEYAAQKRGQTVTGYLFIV